MCRGNISGAECGTCWPDALRPSVVRIITQSSHDNGMVLANRPCKRLQWPRAYGCDVEGHVNREQRFEAIAVAEAAVLTPLADAVLADTDVAVIRGPTAGMVMLQARESVEGIRFNVGEVLVTEALVAIGPHQGYALVQGMAHELALAG